MVQVKYGDGTSSVGVPGEIVFDRDPDDIGPRLVRLGSDSQPFGTGRLTFFTIINPFATTQYSKK